MKDKMRLDKLLSSMGVCSRRQVQEAVKKGAVICNGEKIKQAGQIVDPYQDKIFFQGQRIVYEQFIYIMMNKPMGYISATKDEKELTVMELLQEPWKSMDLFIAGRLDKDTEGFLLITNDGAFAHAILSPRKHVPKTYFVRIDAQVTQKDIEAFQQGILLEDGMLCQSAELVIAKSGAVSEVYLTIYEGKFHQVKRMFLCTGKKVIYLKRVAMGALCLDETLKPGMYKKLTKEDIAKITV